MSHNLLKVNSQAPDDTGQVSLSLSDLVTMTPNQGDVLQTNSNGDWVSSSVASSSVDNVANITNQFSYAVGTYPYGAGDNLIIFKTYMTLGTGVSHVNASGSYVPVANSAWTMGFSFNGTAFNGKTVILRAVPSPSCVLSTFVAQWGFGTGSLASFTPIGARARVDATHADLAWGRFVGDGTTKTVALKILSRTGSTNRLKLANGSQAATYAIDMKVL